jgi:hypothetical protein
MSREMKEGVSALKIASALVILALLALGSADEEASSS